MKKLLKVDFQKKLEDVIVKVSWECEKGQVVSLFGPSGSGKTLTLRMIAGLMEPDDGWIQIDQNLVYHSEKKVNLPARNRRIGYVPQNYGLFPHMKVQDNILFGMEGKNLEEKEIQMMTWLKAVGMAHKRHQYPRTLSGGEKQRVAILRALAGNPKVLLLDEPFASVDPATRNTLRAEIGDFLSRQGVAVVLVTHDWKDVKIMGDTVIHFQ